MSLYNVQLVTLEKDADQSVSSSTTLANDTHLTFPVLAGRRYKFFGCLRFNLAGIISGYKFGWSTPASPQNASDSGAITVKQNSWLSIVAL